MLTTLFSLLKPYRLWGTVFLLVLTLYSVTLAPGVIGGDAGEHQFAAPLLAIPHATGYPLYILLGKLWTMILPTGSMAWRMNLFSAVWGAAAAGLTSVIVYRLSQRCFDSLPPASSPSEKAGSADILVGLPAGRWTLPYYLTAILAGLVLAWGLTLWQWSIIAGVRSLNVFFFALLTFEAIRWQEQQQAGQTVAAQKTLCWLAVTVGLSLAHHRTTVFYLPALAGWVLWHDRHPLWQPGRWLRLLGLATAPLLLYAFIYFRGINDPPYSHEYITDWQSFWFLVGASDSSGLFLDIDLAYLPARLDFIWQDILAQFSWPGVVMVALGGLLLAWRQPKQFLFQGWLVVSLGLFVLDFEVVNLNEAPTWYLMPAFFIGAVWFGVGLSGLMRGIYDLRFRVGDLLGGLVPLIYGLGLIYSLAWPNWQQIYQQSTQPLDDWRQLLRGNQAQRFVESSLPYVAPGSLLLGDWEQYTPMIYYQLINGQRLDVEPRLPLDNWPRQVAAARQQGQPVYFMRKTSDLIGTPHLSMVGPLIHLRTEAQTAMPARATPLVADLEGELELLGYQLDIVPQSTPGGRQAGPIIQLSLYWRAQQALQWDYAISLRLLDEAGQEIVKQDAAHPVLSSYPTSLWTPGEVVGDFYELPFPPSSGPLTLWILVYRTEGPGQWHNLILTGSDPPQPGVRLGPVR